MKRLVFCLVVLFAVSGMFGPAKALLLGVSGPNSSAGTAPAIIAPPPHALEDFVTNTGMQGFDEAQGVLTTVAHNIDGGGSIPAGTLVDSHMIFLNTVDSGLTTHFQVDWTFSGQILGVMSDGGGNLEAASTFELGAPGTNYTTTFPGSGAAAPYGARGLENQGGGGGVVDGYAISGNQLRVDMRVSEPGDWIRVITEVIEVSIDIKPWSDPNAINLKSKGVIPVAILGSATFDAATVDVTSLSFGPAGAAPVHDLTDPDVLADHTEDVNGDGFTDLVSHYNVQDTGIAAGDTKACLTGLTVFSQAIKGCDAIVTVPKAAPSQGYRGPTATWGKIKSR